MANYQNIIDNEMLNFESKEVDENDEVLKTENPFVEYISEKSENIFEFGKKAEFKINGNMQ